MKAEAVKFITLMSNPKQFIVPIYQRTYSWQKIHCEKLLTDIKNAPSSGHFVGSVVYFQDSIYNTSVVPKLLLIDGQQRITTLSLLIAALANFLKDKPDLNQLIGTSYNQLRNYYLFNNNEEGELRNKLLLTRKDKETLTNLINGINLGNEYSTRILENYNYFVEKINAENVSNIYKGITHLFIVDVALEKDKDNPQLIFESLNSTGLDLSQADLIRNFILMDQEIDLQKELYERYWFPMETSYGNEYLTYFDRFIRDYLSVKTGSIPNMNKVYDEFKNYAKNSNLSIKELVEDINKFSKYYTNMVLLNEPDIDLKECFKNLSKLKVDVSYPFLLPVYNDYSNNTITKEVFLEIINLIENYVFRRAVCGIPTNSMNKTFVTLYKSIKKDSYLESLKAELQLLDSYKRFPNDIEFEKELLIKDIYKFRNIKYLLNKLENFNRREIVNIDEYTIEHIMPQNENLSRNIEYALEWQNMLGENWKEIHDKYVDTIGNLTLTGYNSELSDSSFTIKKTIEGGFNDSPIRLNDFPRRVDVWNEEQIQKRAKELYEKAKKIWFAPNLSQEVLAKYKPEIRDNAIYTIESYEYLKGDMLELYYALKKRILNIDSSVKEEYKKQYIAFKASTNFVDIVPQKSRLRLSLNINFSDINDPKGLCKDVSSLGRWGNGNVEVGLSNLNEIDDVMYLIQQSFDKQMEYF